MGHVVIHMLEEAGHIRPTFELARALAARGHRVTYLEPPDLRPLVTEQGFAHAPLFEEAYPAGSLARFESASRLERLRMRRASQHAIMRALQDGSVARALERAAPDLLLVDLLENAVALVGRALGIPTVVLSTVFPPERGGSVPPLSSGLPPGRTALGRLRVELAWQRLALSRAVGARAMGAMERAGLTLDPRPDWPRFVEAIAGATGYPRGRLVRHTSLPVPLLSDLPEWVLAPEVLDFPRARPANRLYVESVDDERVEDAGGELERVDESRDLVYCALGTQAFRYGRGPSLLGAMVAAVAGHPRWQLVLVADRRARERLGELPPNVVVLSRAPQLALLARARVAVHHGGLGSVKEALFHGVPQLVAPQGYDQPGNAARVAFHGAGAVLTPRDVEARSIRAHLEELDGSLALRERVRRLSARFREAERRRPGLREAVRVLEGGA